MFIALITVLSSVGICERCRIESGGVYFVIAHVLGSKFGGSLGLLYCFGQVSCFIKKLSDVIISFNNNSCNKLTIIF